MHAFSSQLDHSSRWRVRLVAVALLAVVAAGVALVAAESAAATNRSGTYATDATWTKATSPQVLTGDVTVAAGVTLTIEPGVIVKASGSTFRQLTVNGTLRAEGTAEDRIVFTSAQDDSAGGSLDGTPSVGNRGDWYRIRVTGSGARAIFDYADIRYGGYSSPLLTGNFHSAEDRAGIYVASGATASVNHARITDNMQTGVGVNAGSVSIANSLLAHNYRAVSGFDYSIEIDRSTIRDNSGHATYFMLQDDYVGSNYIHDSMITRSGGNALWAYLPPLGPYPPAASMPHGTRNNIYGNRLGEPSASPTEIYISAFYSTLDWKGNFWGSKVTFAPNSAGCVRANRPGTLRHGSGPLYPLYQTTVRATDPQTGSSVYCLTDFARIGANEFSTTPFFDSGAPASVDPNNPLFDNWRTFGSCVTGLHAETPIKCMGDPVQSATGNFTHSAVDLRLPGIAVPFEFARSYNSLDTSNGPLGRGWGHSYDIGLGIASNGDVVFRGEHGQQLQYTKQADGSFAGTAGVRSELEKTADGYKLTRTDQVAYRFSDAGEVTSIRDRNGQGLSFTHTNGQLTGITDSAGGAVALSYDAAGKLSEIKLPDERKVTYGYTNGLLTSATDARGKITTYTYDSGQRLATEVDPNGHTVFANTYGTNGRVTQQIDALGNKTTFAWDATKEIATATDARGKIWKDVYRDRVLVERIDPLGNTTLYGYDDDYNLVSETDPRGKTTTSTYDARGNVVKQTAPAPLSYEQNWTYNARNDVTSATDGRGNATTFGYDAAGNLTSVTEPGNGGLGFTTEFGRDPAGTGLLKSITDPRGKTTTFEHDAAGNLTRTTSPGGSIETMGYDGSGRLTSRVAARGNVEGANPDDYKTTYTYNSADQLTSVTDPLGHTWSFGYDDVGARTSRTDPKDHTTTWSYDAANRLTGVTAPDNATTSYGYDAIGNMTSRTDANNHTTTWTYDAANRLQSEISPTNDTYSYGYDKAGNLTQVIDANGNATTGDTTDGMTTYSYDALNRLTAINYSDQTPDVTFAYDGNGNRIEMTDGAGTETYGYDARNNLTDVTRGTDVFSYTYDPAGNLDSRTYPGGRATTHTYNDDGELASATSDGQTTSYSYDPDGNLTRTELPVANGHLETRAYDRAGRLNELVSAKSGTTLWSGTYTHDEVGNPTAVQTSDGPVNYTHDAQDRVTEVCYAATCTGPSDPFIRYGYDAVGNRTSETRPSGTTTYDYDGADRLSSKTTGGTTTSYSFDENGNQTAAGQRTFSYDLADRLKSTTADGTTETYTYDGDGKRLTASTGAGAADTAKYLWDITHPNAQLAIERDGNNDSLRGYTYGLDRIAMHTGGNAFYYHHDAIGSVTNVTSASGAKQRSYSYEPFGSTRTSVQDDPNAPVNPMRFAGEQLDTTTGLYHLRARQYDPATGRFLAADPLPEQAADPHNNTYHYARNRPGVLGDPSGMGPVWLLYDECTELPASVACPPSGPREANSFCSSIQVLCNGLDYVDKNFRLIPDEARKNALSWATTAGLCTAATVALTPVGAAAVCAAGAAGTAYSWSSDAIDHP
jgi:RHS repeat-associated protein